MYVEYQLNARRLERAFQRKVTRRGFFTTANGCINYITNYSNRSLMIKTSKGEKSITIIRSQLRKALSFFYFHRTAIRKDMEKFSNFSSALFGLVAECFKAITKFEVLRNGLFRLSLKNIRFHASGMERDKDILQLYKNLGGKFVLMNYFQCLQSPKWLKHLEEFDLYSLIDSGAFSEFNQKRKKLKKKVQQQELFDDELNHEMIIHGYAQFINQHKNNPRILGFFPYDVVGDPKKTKEYYHKLKELTNAKIIPVWQVTDSISELEKLVEEEHEMYAVGGMVPYLSNRQPFLRKILDNVTKRFPTINLHLLGCANEFLIDYRAFSADSTCFINARKSDKQRKIYLPNGERVNAPDHMSTKDIIKQNLEFLLSLENVQDKQLSIEELLFKGVS